MQLVLRMVCDMTGRSLEFLLQFIRLLRRSGLVKRLLAGSGVTRPKP